MSYRVTEHDSELVLSELLPHTPHNISPLNLSYCHWPICFWVFQVSALHAVSSPKYIDFCGGGVGGGGGDCSSSSSSSIRWVLEICLLSKISRPDVRPAQPPIQLVPAFFRGGTAAGTSSWASRPSSADNKNEWSCTSTRFKLIHLRGVGRDNFILTYTYHLVSDIMGMPRCRHAIKCSCLCWWH